MADHDHVNKLLFLLPCLFLLISVIDSHRHGSSGNSLHIPKQKFGDQIGERTIIIEADLDSLPQVKNENSYERVRRSVAKHTLAAKFSTVTQLNDSHTQMIVHWAGEGSDVIIALARDSRKGPGSSSNLFISRDYGKSFKNATGNLVIPSGNRVVIDHYYNSKTLNSHYIFADVTNKYIFTTTDYGQTFTPHMVDFEPSTISIHPTKPNTVLGMDKENDSRKRMYVSTDFGTTWRMMQEGVKTFYWGDQDNEEDTIYIERIQMDGGSSVIKSNDYFVFDAVPLIMDAEDFQMVGQYMFATKTNKQTRSTKELWVSYDHRPFVKAEFGNNLDRKGFYVADATEEQVFLCVQHNETSSHLYISDITGTKYSLSLENIIYYSPDGANKDSWLKYFSQEAFADVTKVEAIRGVYIANQQINSSQLTIEGQRSLITFDKGGEWRPIMAPFLDQNGKQTNCTMNDTKALQSGNCSLHLTQEFSKLYPGSRASNILSKKSAPGIVIGMGVVGKNLKHDPDMFISSDAGYSWHQVLEGNQYYAMGDHGGLIISVPQFRTTNELFYSWNEGESWTNYTFHDEKIRVYGVLTEPGEMTSIFTLFGSHLEKHQWLIIQIDLHEIFPYQCNENDYKMWSFPDQKPYFGCILGKKTVYERRIAHAECFNGRDYDREIVEKNCSCTREDFECDLGFLLAENTLGVTQGCEVDPNSTIDTHGPPTPCPEGTFYPYSKGYRRIPGDVCHGGEEYRYAPYMLSCPVAESTEFLLYSSRTFIRRHLFGSERDESVVDLNGMQSSIYAVAFDYRENSVYWAGGQPSKIMKMSLNGRGNMTVVAEAHGMVTVESLAYDWTGGNIYWVDSGNQTIEVAKKNGQFRRRLISSKHLDRPRSLVLDPHFGFMYWTDWSRSNPRITKAPMDGNDTFVQVIVNGTRNVYWPNGITIDHRSMRIYWTDAHLDRISSANLDGSDIKQLIQGTYFAPHPYAIGIYKDKIYWSDWLKKGIFSADKRTGRGIITVKSNITDVMDLKILDYLSQHDQTACSSSNGGCSQLCLPKPGIYDMTKKNRTCKCGDLMPKSIIASTGDERCTCPPGEQFQNNSCVAEGSGTCAADRTKCRNGDCIPSTWICDHDTDCSDGSDELDCPYSKCAEGSWQCGNGHCIPERWHCDFDNDCGDNSDERNCTYRACKVDEFHCNNGRCINKNWTCDFDDDCRDGSDENLPECRESVVCSDDEFRCAKHQPRCIPYSRVCDGLTDCTDRSDEINCNATTCSDSQFRCGDGQCIYRTWQCDGAPDCKDKSDEMGCTTTSTTTMRPTTTQPHGQCFFWQFNCNNRKCVWWSNKCDGVNDCGDNSDELNCGWETTSPAAPATCASYQFTCYNGQCISNIQKCDGHEDCPDASDELSCDACSFGEYKCNDSKCIAQTDLCDGFPDCRSGEDELNCQDHACTTEQFRCVHSGECIPMNSLCNSKVDCADRSDETALDCKPTAGNKTVAVCPKGQYQCPGDTTCLNWIYVCDGHSDCMESDDEDVQFCGSKRFVTLLSLVESHGRNMTVEWSTISSTSTSKNIENTLSYMDYKTKAVYNVTTCQQNKCTITGLKPLTMYLVTVYVIENKVIQRLHSNRNFSTIAAVPDAPQNVRANVEADGINVQWDKVSDDNGVVNWYHVYCLDTNDKSQTMHRVNSHSNSRTILPDHFYEGHKYNIWVTASNAAGDSVRSTIKHVTNHEDAVTDVVPNAKVIHKNISCVTISWDLLKVAKVQNYVIQFTDTWEQEIVIKIDPNATSRTVCDLCPSEPYIFFLFAANNHGNGPHITLNYLANVKSSYIPTWSKNSFDSVDSGKYKVNWNAPIHTDKGLTLEYTVFYSFKNSDMERYATNATRNVVHGLSNTILTGLRACESYSIRVAVSKPGRCRPCEEKVMQTGEDDSAQPENVKPVFAANDPTSVDITWNAGCYIPDPQGYVINMTEDRTGHHSISRLAPTANITTHYTFHQLSRGANYTFRVKVDNSKGRWSEPAKITVLPYGPPEDFKQLLQTDGKLALSWNAPKDAEGHVQKYEIFWKRMRSATDKAEFTSLELVDKDHQWYNVNTVPGTEYSFKIRIIADNGYPGQFTEEPFIEAGIPEAQNQQSINISKTKMIAIVLAVTGVVIALVLVLGFFIVRHRRLQRSFLAYANSHYDTRSGTTTFESNELGEDEDSPMIQGFSDDEPLVIA